VTESCGHHHHDHHHDHASLGEHHERTDAICVDRVSFRYAEVEALRQVTLHVEAGTKLGIIGRNGGGKTTLLKIMLGLLEGYDGRVTIGGHSPREVCRRGDVVGYVPQKHEFEPRFPVSVRQVVRMGLVGKTGLFHRHAPADLDRVEALLESVGTADLADRPIGSLSGGQQQRAFIARALAPGPSVLLLDEPTVGIDVAGQKRFADLINTLQQQLALTVVVVSHDIGTIAAGCDMVACLNRTIHYHDAPQGLTEQVLHEVFSHEIAGVVN